MNDPIIWAVAHHWGLILAFVVFALLFARGFMELVFGPRYLRGAFIAAAGMIGFADCVIRSLRNI